MYENCISRYELLDGKCSYDLKWIFYQIYLWQFKKINVPKLWGKLVCALAVLLVPFWNKIY